MFADEVIANPVMSLSLKTSWLKALDIEESGKVVESPRYIIQVSGLLLLQGFSFYVCYGFCSMCIVGMCIVCDSVFFFIRVHVDVF